MTVETFFANFGHLADAPNGVLKLRELILQLAVQGKLVEQDSNDEPSSVLLEKIKSERLSWVKEKRIRNSKPLHKIEPCDHLFHIPGSWLWTRLGEYGDWGAGATPSRQKSSYYGGSMLWLKSGELNDSFVNASVETITELALKECSLRIDKPGDVLIAMYGATIGKVAILEIEATTNQAVCACTCLSGIYNRFLFLLLKAYRPFFTGQGAGGAQPNISREKIIATPVPLPPLEEQKRIVAKVDQLMALCNELETCQQKRQQGRVRLNNAALDALLTAREPDEFADHWQRISTNFNLLYDHPETIAKLRAAILQLAVQGKLVPQDPNDEPASVLLKRIVADRQTMISDRSLKRFKLGSPVKNSDFPFQPPEGWQFERMGNLFQFVDYRGKTPKKVDSGVKLITAKNVRMGHLKNEPQEFVTEKTYHEWMTRGFPQVGDLLFTTEAPMGNVCLVELEEPFALAQRTINLHPFSDQNSRFLMFAIMSGVVQELISELATGMTATGIKAAKLKLVPLPLPPLKEQKRIVAKVDQLMALCDELEAKLSQAQQHSEKLMAATVRQLLVA